MTRSTAPGPLLDEEESTASFDKPRILSLSKSRVNPEQATAFIPEGRKVEYPSMEYGRVTDKELEFIKEIVGPERISVGESILELHSKDESFHQKRKPDVMVWLLCATEISQILRLANEKRIPITPWGAGTSLEGNPIPVEGGIILDLQQMNHILELRTEDLHVRVEAGVIYKELNQYLSRYGLFFPPDPGASATIGGMVGNNASGIRTIKYGATNDFVDEADQKTFRSPWHHESGEDFCLASCIGLKA